MKIRWEKSVVTNLTPEAKAKWAEAIAAKDPELKLKLLREFYSVMPKHKSTEKLELSIKRQISFLREQVKAKGKRKTGSTKPQWTVRKEEELQLALVGRLESAVKVFNTLTDLHVNVYTTLMKPVVGVFNALNVRAQVVLTPMDESMGDEKRYRFVNVVRNTDALLIVVDDQDYTEKVTSWFEASNIDITSGRPNVELEYTPHGGVRIVGRSEYVKESDMVEFVKSFKIRNALVKLYANVTMDDLEDAIFGRVAKRSVFVLMKDLYVQNGIKFYTDDKERFMQDLLSSLELIRIFTKKVDSDPVQEPLLLNNNSRVIDLAHRIHRDLARNFRFARIWREGKAVKVGKDFPLKDLDVIEVHVA